jgi:hypothetical protein
VGAHIAHTAVGAHVAHTAVGAHIGSGSIGAAVGTLVLPGVGTAVGGVLGLVVARVFIAIVRK